jgi:glycosyltransferase A (GT-A) superfamily protein (DUF2064 family)
MAIFTVAILLVVGAVWALAAVGGWWMLGLAMLVHLCVSALVMFEVARVIGGRKTS